MKTADEIMALVPTEYMSDNERAALRAAVEQIVRERDAHAKASSGNYEAFCSATERAERAEQEVARLQQDVVAAIQALERAEQDNKLTRALLEEKTLTNQQLNEALEHAEQEAAELRALLTDMCGRYHLRGCDCKACAAIDAALGEKNG